MISFFCLQIFFFPISIVICEVFSPKGVLFVHFDNIDNMQKSVISLCLILLRHGYICVTLPILTVYHDSQSFPPSLTVRCDPSVRTLDMLVKPFDTDAWNTESSKTRFYVRSLVTHMDVCIRHYKNRELNIYRFSSLMNLQVVVILPI